MRIREPLYKKSVARLSTMQPFDTHDAHSLSVQVEFELGAKLDIFLAKLNVISKAFLG